MAGIYSGIHLKLKNSKVPWEHKLKLARFAWVSHQCFIPNKEQFLLDWVSQTLVGFQTKKQYLEEDVEHKFWIFLDNILHSKKLKNLIEDGKSLQLRFAIAQVMNDVFATAPIQSSPSANIGTVLSCCQGVLSIPCFAMVYTAKCELMVQLLSKLCLLACRCLTSKHTITHKVLNILNMSLKQYILLQRQQSNSNRLFMHVVTQLFEPCLLLWNALNGHEYDRDGNNGINQLVKDIVSNIEDVLQTGLFQAELLTFYEEQLLPHFEKSEKKKGTFKYSLTPVGNLLAKLEKIEFDEKETQLSFLANSVTLLYKLFLDSYCRNGNKLLGFQMFVKLFRCLCAPFTVKQDKEKVFFPVWSVGITALESMLNLVLSHNVYNIAEDNIRGDGIQYKFYRSLTELLVCNSSKCSLPWFRCLKTLNLLNHLIVEPDLVEILRACFDADISDMHIRKVQETLVVSLLQTYTKLRQFPQLFQKILMVICQSPTENLKHPILLSGLQEKLAEFLVKLPPNQMLDMWYMVLENCQLSHVEDPNFDLKLEHLGLLLHCLMINMKSLDCSTPVPVVHRFQHLMKQIVEELILPSLSILKKYHVEDDATPWLRKLCEVVLMLIYTWIEVNTVTAINCDKYVSQMRELSFPLNSSLECWDFSIFFEEKECWWKVHNLCRQSNIIGMFYLGLLSIQKIKLILRHSHMPTEYEKLTLQAAASVFVKSSTILLNHKDQKLYTVCFNVCNNNCLPVLQWHCIVSNIIILLPYISLDDMNYIANFLLESQLATYDESKELDSGVAIAFKQISKSFVLSDSFSEMSNLQCIFITSIINKCAILAKKQSVFSEILALLSLKDLDWHEHLISVYEKGAKIVNQKAIDCGDDSLFVTNMTNALQLVSSAAQSNEFASFTDINLLMNLLELISMLKPDSLPPSDVCRCFSLLLTLANACSPKSIHVLSICFRSLTCLLNSSHANNLFKIACPSDILKVVMACIQSAKWNVTKEPSWPEFLDIMISFFDTFLSLLTKRKRSALKNLEKCSVFVLDSISNVETFFWSTCVGQLYIVMLKSLCQYLTLAVQEQNANEEHIECFNCLLKQTAVKLRIIIQQCLESAVSNPCSLSILVTAVSALLEKELAEGEFQDTEMYRIFCLAILKELCYAKEQNTFFKSALHYLTICIAAKEVYPEQLGLANSVFTAVGNLLACSWSNFEILQNAEIELQSLFNEVTENCTCEEFHVLLKFVFNKLEVRNLWKKNYKVLFAGITMIRLLLKCSLQQDKSMLFWATASQIINALVTLSVEACKERLLLSIVVVPVLETMALMLRGGEQFLSNPHHVTLSLSTLLIVPLENVKAEDYYRMFLAIHEVLFSVLQCHPKVMLNSAPTFLSCFHRLVASVMHEGQQKGDKGTICVKKCAMLVERMYSYIAAKTEEFTVFSTFIISQYIHELQKVTLQPEVKKCLTEGIFHILDLCIDRDIKFLNTSLQIGAREVFKELYHDYVSHYKSKNQEEEKYTA